jgi:hypothetical protein
LGKILVAGNVAAEIIDGTAVVLLAILDKPQVIAQVRTAGFDTMDLLE